MCTKRCLLYCKKETGKSVLYKENGGLLSHGSAWFLQKVACFDGLNDLHITSEIMIFCNMISMNNCSDCGIAPCEQGSTAKNLCLYCKPQNMDIFKGVIYNERPSGSKAIKCPFAERSKMDML